MDLIAHVTQTEFSTLMGVFGLGFFAGTLMTWAWMQGRSSGKN